MTQTISWKQENKDMFKKRFSSKQNVHEFKKTLFVILLKWTLANFSGDNFVTF